MYRNTTVRCCVDFIVLRIVVMQYGAFPILLMFPYGTVRCGLEFYGAARFV